ncbi:hypothetical protein PZA11_006328 [Diplocarpon coronariae]|uniref:Acyltransferase 3 domain-containing protein n=1 Tax=Diplocarpon coronariae TaxID=2795749 RepID=A0A218YXI4_9HELO|nr:acyltransferase [Diplocarpon mali]OWP00013.1 hypothetical protein B2J93_2360 [Marssonina coronariae]
MSNSNPDSPTSWQKDKIAISPDSDNLLEKGQWQGVGATDTQLPLLRRALRIFKDIIRPAILTKGPPAKNQLSRTAYLDGLRGFAALLVYVHHHELWVRETDGDAEIFENGFGYNGRYHLATFPFIRLIFCGGHFAVPIFFVVSAYALSVKPLSLIHAGELNKLSDSFSSSIFRRWMRLWMPVATTTFIYMTLCHYPGFYTDDYVHQATYREEVWEWYTKLKNFSFMFDTGGNPFFPFNGHLWTIPVEFKGSVAVYMALISFSRFTQTARLACTLALIYYFIYVADGCFYAMFMAGVLLADLDLLALSHRLPRFLARLEPYKELIYVHLLVLGCYLGGAPAHDQDVMHLRATRGWYYLSFLKPQAAFNYKWFFMFWAALFTVSAVPRLGPIRRFFESRFCQYLGKISFGLYLVHGPVLCILGDRLYSAVGWVRVRHETGIPLWVNAWPMSHAGPLGLEWAFLVPHLILLPFTLWMAEICTRFIDTPSIKIGQTLHRRFQRDA